MATAVETRSNNDDGPSRAPTFSLKNVKQEPLVLVTTLIIVVLCTFTVNGFMTFANISALARSVSVLGILGVGMAVVVIGRGLDLSQVAIMAICAAWSLKLLGLGYGLLAALGLGLGLSVIVGIFNGFAISIIGIPALFTTLASGTMFYGIGRWLMLDGIITYVPQDNLTLVALGQGEMFGLPVPVIAFAIVAAIGHFILSRTTLGRFVYAFGDNAESARLSGISVRVLAMQQYAFSAVLAFLAGLAPSRPLIPWCSIRA